MLKNNFLWRIVNKLLCPFKLQIQVDSFNWVIFSFKEACPMNTLVLSRTILFPFLARNWVASKMAWYYLFFSVEALVQLASFENLTVC